MGFTNKYENKIAYALLLFSIETAKLFSIFLVLVNYLLPKANNKKDIIFYPYAQPGSDGYTRRFEEYFPYFKKENFIFYSCNLISNHRYVFLYYGTIRQQYYLYHIIIWKRIWQVFKARNYKAAFIQRGLYPFYPDLTNPFLEKLLRKTCKNITVDIWDSVWIVNPELIKNTVKYVDKISVVNTFIEQYFKEAKAQKIIFPIGVNLHKYQIKKTYEINGKIRIVYTGLPENVIEFLSIIKPILSEINKIYPLCLILITRYRESIDSFETEFHDFSESTFFKLLQSADIGLYAVNDTENSRGKMAMKVLDYMSSGIPTVITPIGISPFVFDDKNALFASNENEFQQKLELLICNKELREKIGTNARETVEKHHSIESSYIDYRNIILNTEYSKLKT